MAKPPTYKVMKPILTPAAVTSSLKIEVLVSSGTLQISSHMYGFTKQLSLQCISNILLINYLSVILTPLATCDNLQQTVILLHPAYKGSYGRLYLVHTSGLWGYMGTIKHTHCSSCCSAAHMAINAQRV
jgi:hypothetical protein